MDAIILAGGKGTRLREVIGEAPKALAKIQGVPFLRCLLHQLEQTGLISRVILALGYEADQILRYLDTLSFSIPIEISLEKMPLGTGGALKKALGLAKSKDVFACNGDTLLSFSLSLFLSHHRNCKAPFSLVCKNVENPSSFGTIVFDPTTFRICSFEEKKENLQSGWVNGGFYLLDSQLFKESSFPEVFSLEQEGFPALLHKGLFAYPNEGFFLDIGTKDRYQLAQELDQELKAWLTF